MQTADYVSTKGKEVNKKNASLKTGSSAQFHAPLILIV